MNDDKKNPSCRYGAWYSAGLHFECLQCGRCCSGPAEGYIWVSRPEIKLIARYLNIPVSDLKSKFFQRIGPRMTIIEDAVTRDCVFLKRTHTGRQCSIYPVRPNQCRTWPFWPGNLKSPDSWNSVGQKCPGINRGTFYNLEQIESKRDRIPWWRNEKS